jgi:predicted LPLAT superfamily acyltransferase
VTNTPVVATTTASVSTSETEAAVRAYFKDIPVMIQIARCESHFQHTLADGSILHGRVDPADTGVMQINKRFHQAKAAAMGLDLDDLHGNMVYARHLYETQGTAPWTASAYCWNPVLASNI